MRGTAPFYTLRGAEVAFVRALESFGHLVTWTRLFELLVPALMIGTEQFIVGAVVGRLSRPVGPPIALVYGATMLGASAISFVVFMTGNAAPGEQLVAGSQYLVTLCVALLAAVMGALWATGSRRDQRSPTV